jgi:hypothetical protein
MEFISEVYEQCSENKTCMRLLTNALLYYCYLPIVLPTLVGCDKAKNNIGIQTSLYVLTMTMRLVKSQQLHNAFALVLLNNKIPVAFERLLTMRGAPKDPVVSYRFKWSYRLPVHYSKTKFLQEYFSLNCGETFVREYKDSIKFCKQLDQLFEDANAKAQEE